MQVKPSLSALVAQHHAGRRPEAAVAKPHDLHAHKAPVAAHTRALGHPRKIDPSLIANPSASPVQGPQTPTVSPDGLSIEGLREAWGTDNADYDFNADGIVDALDMLELLRRLGAQPAPATTLAPIEEDVDGQSASAGEPQPATGALGAADAAPVEATAAGDTAAPALTVEGLHAAWGTDDPDYDLNQDGTVDALDLLDLLARLGGEEPATDGVIASAAAPPSANEDATAVEDVPVAADLQATPTAGETPEPQPVSLPGPLSIEGLREAWGTDDARYDFNADGVVDALDMLELIARLRTEPTVEANNLFGGNTAAASAGDGAGPLTLEGLQKAWGTGDARYDFNADGTVDALDMLTFLAHMRGERSHDIGGGNRHALGHDHPRGVNESSSHRPPADIARRLTERLAQAGFTDQPPTNIHEIVDRFDLPHAVAKGVLKQLAHAYPHGLGVNQVG